MNDQVTQSHFCLRYDQSQIHPSHPRLEENQERHADCLVVTWWQWWMRLKRLWRLDKLLVDGHCHGHDHDYDCNHDRDRHDQIIHDLVCDCHDRKMKHGGCLSPSGMFGVRLLVFR